MWLWLPFKVAPERRLSLNECAQEGRGNRGEAPATGRCNLWNNIFIFISIWGQNKMSRRDENADGRQQKESFRWAAADAAAASCRGRDFQFTGDDRKTT